MGYENFDTYDVVDEDGDFAIDGSTITVTTIQRDALSHVSDDKGVDHFGDFTHWVEIKQTGSLERGFCSFWALANTVDSTNGLRAANDGFSVRVQRTSTKQILNMERHTDSAVNFFENLQGTQYYLIIERNDTALTCDIYTDALHTQWEAQLSLSVVTTLFRYVYGVSSFEEATYPGEWISFIVKHLDLKEGGVEDTHEATDTSSASDFISTVREKHRNLTDTASVSDAISFKVSKAISDISNVIDDVVYLPCPKQRFTITSPTITLTMDMPEWDGGENRQINKNIDVINFWTDDLDTVDKGKISEPIVLTGIETGESLSAKFINIWGIQNRHEEITITGLGDCMDGVYIIKNFHFETIPKNARFFKWSMSLEFVRGIT